MRRIAVETPGGALSALVWDAAPAGSPWLHFAHATGMHGGLYARLLAPLADRFNIVASDARGHGRSYAADPALLTGWEDFADDMLAVMAAVAGDARWLLAGHSMGGTASLLATWRAPERAAGLVLVDPAFLPFAMAALVRGGQPLPNPMADQAGKRRADFPDVATARAAYAGRGVFRAWSDADLDAYLADGLRDAPDGVTLACAPLFEAATFRAVSPHVETALAALAVPFALVAGDVGSTVPAAEFALMAAHPRCLSAQRLAGTTHFVPLERGEVVRAAIAAVSGGASGAVAR